MSKIGRFGKEMGLIHSFALTSAMHWIGFKIFPDWRELDTISRVIGAVIKKKKNLMKVEFCRFSFSLWVWTLAI